MKKFRNIWREPLIHFVLIGAALFLWFELDSAPEKNEPNRIVVSARQSAQLGAQFQRTWMRPPTTEELDGLIESYVRDEVYYREALSMGLDREDPLIRQRMRQKLEFILEDLTAEKPSDAVLAAYLRDNPDEFQPEPRVSFRQVYLNPEKHRDFEGDARNLLDMLNKGSAAAPMGDPTRVPHAFTGVTLSEIGRSFGHAFARQVVALVAGKWSGPHYSGLGAHLVLVTDREMGRVPELAEIRDQVEREYLAERRQVLKEIAYTKLARNYEVIIEPPSAQTAKAGEAMAAPLPGGTGQ